MPSKVVTKSKKPEAKVASKSTESNHGAAVVVAKATIVKGNGNHDNVYDDAVKEVVALSENDTYARKVDNGPLSEARGKDTWRLHAQLRAVDQVNINMTKEASAIKTGLSTLDEHLHTDTVAVTELVERHGSSIASSLASAKSSINGSIATAQQSLSKTVVSSQNAITTSVEETKESLAGQITKFSNAVKDKFEHLAKATAGSEENLRAQTQAFSKAVEELLNTLQNNFEKQILEFRDESTRLIDKRFNQSDVAFAAVRADQEVIKALLTDIIKDRLGRAEPRVR